MKLNNIDLPFSLEKIILHVEEQGGESYLVGGAVIDLIQGRILNDWDIEVYKLSLQKLEDLLSKHGNSNLVSKSFGIIKIRIHGIEYDFSVPRKESGIGLGHKDFLVELVPDITPEEAARRRDLTINSMFINLVNKELIDSYGGLKDLEAGILRHTSEKFAEDPLRVLRVMQLLARKGRIVAPETISLCESLSDRYYAISKERVFEEWIKLLMKSNAPSMGLQFLVDCKWISHYPELENLIKTPQNLEWHPEGSVWAHTMLIADNAAALRDKVPPEWREAFMYGALLHDVGKAKVTTKDLRSISHAGAGVPLAREFMERITRERTLTEQVLNIVEYHMQPGQLQRAGAKEAAWKRLHNCVPLNVLGYISKADCASSAGRSLDDIHLPSLTSLQMFEKYGQKKIPPLLMGRDLLAAGYDPGPELGKLLHKAYQIQIDEEIADKEALIKKIMA